MNNIADDLFEIAYKDLDRFISDKFDMLQDLLENKPTGKILVGSASWSSGWETGFRRCLAELEKMASNNRTSDTAHANPPKQSPTERSK